jgi:excisionase family DNA binding protein
MRFLTIEQVSEVLALSPRQLREHCRQGHVPHRRPAGTRRYLFSEQEIAAWLDGATLEVVESPAGGRVVRPVESNGSRP